MTTGALRTPRGEALFAADTLRVWVRRDRVLAWLMGVQWVCGVVVALTFSPYGWAGRVPYTHVHVFTAIFIGGALSGSTILLALLRPGWWVTRHAMAVAQMGWSALVIHLAGGRIESHFHVFGSLAFLAFYRDWRVLLTGTLTVASDHFVRGLVWPESVYGITNPEWWRFLEHTFWVAFEDVVLLLGILENAREMREVAEHRAELEQVAATIEARVDERTHELAQSREEMRSLIETTGTVPWTWNVARGRFEHVGTNGREVLGFSQEEWLAPSFWGERIHPDERGAARQPWAGQDGAARDLEFRLRHRDGTWRWFRALVASSPGVGVVKGIFLDVHEQHRVLEELNQAQKLESVGRLAAGIAHEINTPIQFVSDSVHFVSEACTDLMTVIAALKGVAAAAAQGPVPAEVLQEAQEAEDAADVAYLLENVPKALERTVEGLGRVATLVRSMKEFAHPDRKERAAADLNRALQSTLVIARNEYKYVADVELALTPLPAVTCHLNELNQVFLNIIVNAAHAIGDAVKGTERKGKIRISSYVKDGAVEIAIGDTGVGIPEHARVRIFEPFFTTKEVGRGTGQGLSIARKVIDNHGGTLTFETELGVGTTFLVRLPCATAVAQENKQEAA